MKEIYYDNLSINVEGHLTIGGLDTVALAKEFGTPLYVMDENKIRESIRSYRNSINDYYDGNGLVCYASKAFSCKQMYRIAKDEQIGVDVVSMGELYTALSVDTDPALICYHGNNKSFEELTFAVEQNVGRIVVDAFEELDMLDGIAKEAGKRVKILLRLTPGIEAHTNELIMTGGIDSKFGFAIATGTAMSAVEASLKKGNIELEGIHCHIGSQIFDVEPFELAADVMFSFMREVKEVTGHKLLTLNLGGGFGIRYVESDTPQEYDSYMKKVSEALKDICSRHMEELPFIIIEPGRSVVGAAGITLYEVGVVKSIPNVRTYVAVDGGMTDNIRPSLYGANYEFTVANKADKEKNRTVAVAGRCCETDLLAKETKLQVCEKGDIIAVMATGAYNYAMASNYNRLPKPAVVMVKDGKASLAVKRETIEDIIKNDI